MPITKYTEVYFDCGMPCTSPRTHRTEADAQVCIDNNHRLEAIHQARHRFAAIGRQLFMNPDFNAVIDRCTIQSMADTNEFIAEIDAVIGKRLKPRTPVVR